jgi:protein phosphatase
VSLSLAVSHSTPAPHLRLQAVARSDRGLVREHNEDVALARRDLGLLLVADGMGGHEAGAVAAQMAADTIAAGLAEASADTGRAGGLQLSRAIEDANARIFAASAAQLPLQGKGMGTTVVALLDLGRRALVAHVGDSRAYLLRRDTFAPLTEDHTVANAYRAGALRHAEPEQLDGQWHALTRAVGTRRHVEPDFRFFMPEAGDVALLCSDGLTLHLSDAEIGGILAAYPGLDAAADALVAAAHERGALDNVSVVLGRWERAA